MDLVTMDFHPPPPLRSINLYTFAGVCFISKLIFFTKDITSINNFFPYSCRLLFFLFALSLLLYFLRSRCLWQLLSVLLLPSIPIIRLFLPSRFICISVVAQRRIELSLAKGIKRTKVTFKTFKLPQTYRQ